MRVRFWGTRGSIASPGASTVRYGGNTPCVEVRTDDDTLLIFDCGTGARALGMLLAQGSPVRAHLFLSHTHSDHIQGLPFFVPAFQPGSHLTIYGPAGVDRSFPRAVGGQMDYAYFPVPIGDLPSHVDFEELGEGSFSVGAARVLTQNLNHTGPCLGYRLEVGGITLVYATDHEPYAFPTWRPDRRAESFEPESLLHPGDLRHAEFLRGADLVIHDTQYTEAEYPAKVGWGHSPVEYAVDLAIVGRAKRLALFHHDPNRGDEAVDALLAASRARAAKTGRRLDITAAAEGEQITLSERAESPPVEPGPRAPRVPTRARILVAEDDPDLGPVLEEVLAEDGYEVVRTTNGAEAVRLAEQHTFDLILLDVEMPTLDGLAACRALRADPRQETVPIVMLTARSAEEQVLMGFAEGATDYLTKPFAVAQFRARVRAWLTQAAHE
ncbi:MAG TPA: response regulator [Chloroflexota bacterium]|nr:response regulator [Chloroflexota bacterium]